jgi:hypothetical protein
VIHPFGQGGNDRGLAVLGERMLSANDLVERIRLRWAVPPRWTSRCRSVRLVSCPPSDLIVLAVSGICRSLGVRGSDSGAFRQKPEQLRIVGENPNDGAILSEQDLV